MAVAVIAGAIVVSKRRPVAHRRRTSRRPPDAASSTPARLVSRSTDGPASPRDGSHADACVSRVTRVDLLAHDLVDRLARRRWSAAGFGYDGVAGAARPDGARGPVAQRDDARPAGHRAAARRSRRWSGCGRCRRRSTREAADARAARPGRAAGGGRAARARPAARSARGSTYARTPTTAATGGWSATSRPGLDGAPIDVDADHVLGISSASTSLAQLTVREPFGRALDLGTGCGVQALHLAEHVDRRRRDRRQRAGAGDDPAQRRAQRGRRRRAGGQPVRAGRRRALRPGRHQPAVRGLAGHRRAAGLPRLRPARRRGGPPRRHAGARRT